MRTHYTGTYIAISILFTVCLLYVFNMLSMFSVLTCNYKYHTLLVHNADNVWLYYMFIHIVILYLGRYVKSIDIVLQL